MHSSSLAKKELAKRANQALNAPIFLDGIYKLQDDFIAHPSRLKAFFATRRSGKSYSLGKYLIKTAYDFPGTSCVYIGLTRESAKRIMFKDVMKPLNRKYKLQCKFNETQLSVTLPNGSIIYFMGVDSSEDEKDKLLGQKYKLAVIDEAASFSIDLRELVYGTLKPAMADLDGTIVLAGTPSNITKSLFHDITTGVEPNWHVVKATAYDNPFMADKWHKEITELKANQPYIIETPLFKQMYLGEWYIDTDAFVYKFNPQRNLFAQLPNFVTGQFQYLLGVDLGYEDDSAFVVAGFHEHEKCLYLVDCYSRSKMDITDVAQKINELKGKYGINKVIIDGANKQAVEEIQRRHQITLTAADKTGKSDFIEIMNAELIQAHIKVSSEKCADLIDEWQNLVWKERKDSASKREENPSCANHLADAALYVWRYCYSFLGSKPKPKPVYGSKEWADQQATDMEEAAYEHFMRLAELQAEPDDEGYY